jgi:hypothetical protein
MSSGRSRCHGYQIPAVRGYGAWNGDEFVCAQKLIAMGLLPGTGNSRPEPVEVWNQRRIDDMDT